MDVKIKKVEAQNRKMNARGNKLKTHRRKILVCLENMQVRKRGLTKSETEYNTTKY